MSVMEKLRTEQPMRNLNHNLVHTLSKKLDAVTRYSIYINDAEEQGCPECAEIFRRFKEEEMRHIQELRDQICRHCQEGNFR